MSEPGGPTPASPMWPSRSITSAFTPGRLVILTMPSWQFITVVSLSNVPQVIGRDRPISCS